MKVVLLAGGFGTRISEYSEAIPKPMIPIGGRPILWHIMKSYAYYGHKDFFLALGYKAELIKDFFMKYQPLNSDFTVDLTTGRISIYRGQAEDWSVTLINTGVETMTGGRLKYMRKYIGDETFMLSYGDGVSDVNINELLDFHKAHGKMVTVTAVHPGARFGELSIDGAGLVKSFKEKPQMDQGWINGGFFVIEPEFFDLIEGDATVLEKGPLEWVAKHGELMAYSHNGFWQCMDTKRDRDLLEEMWLMNKAPWKL